MKPAFKIFLIILAFAALGTAGFFLWKNNKTAPEAADFSVSPDVNVPTEFQLGDETIPLTWTDGNEGENLIIQSDQKYYDGLPADEAGNGNAEAIIQFLRNINFGRNINFK